MLSVGLLRPAFGQCDSVPDESARTSTVHRMHTSQSPASSASLGAMPNNRERALASLDAAIAALERESPQLASELKSARSLFRYAMVETEIRAVDAWNSGLRAADLEIRTLALARAGWSEDAQTSACTCALIVRNLMIKPQGMTPEEQSREVEKRG